MQAPTENIDARRHGRRGGGTCPTGAHRHGQGGHLPSRKYCSVLQILCEVSVDEVFMHDFEKLSSASGGFIPGPLNSAGGLSSFRPFIAHPLKKILRAPVTENIFKRMNIVWRRCGVSAIWSRLATNYLLFMHTGFSLVQKLVTLNDLERRIGRHNALFHKIRQLHVGSTLTQTVCDQNVAQRVYFSVMYNSEFPRILEST